jgi:FtsZ-interacting cell division protein YlmF
MSGFFKRALSFLGLSDDDTDYNGTAPKDKRGIKKRGTNVKEVKVDTKTNKDDERRGHIFKSRERKKISLLSSPKDKTRSRVFVAEPKEFEEIQIIADNFKENIPVIVNLQKADQDLAKRMIDFCSGLTYALEGNIKKVADKVFLITPYNVEVSSEEKELLREEGFYNNF